MITKNGKEFIGITALGHVILYVRKGARLLWQAIRSCFGSGQWVNEKPWRNDEPWRN